MIVSFGGYFVGEICKCAPSNSCVPPTMVAMVVGLKDRAVVEEEEVANHLESPPSQPPR